jgi:hypothetical protein
MNYACVFKVSYFHVQINLFQFYFTNSNYADVRTALLMKGMFDVDEEVLPGVHHIKIHRHSACVAGSVRAKCPERTKRRVTSLWLL